jgi:dTDP-4-amino-4,6-dideoxygalactose transaminase
MTPIRYEIPVLQADLPTSKALQHWFHKIDHRHIYTNFGPLLDLYEKELVHRRFVTIEPEANKFNRETIEFLKPHVICVSSGTSAIQAAIAGLNLRSKSKILIPSYTFSGTAHAALFKNNEIVFAEVDPKQWILTPQIAKQICEKVKIDLVLPVALFGIKQDVCQWDQFTQETGIPVIIDAASALSIQAIGKKTIVVYSLHATKPLGVGEGGLIASTDELYIRRIKEMINFGIHNGMVHSYGMNGKMNEYSAAIGLAQLDRHDRLQKRRISLYRAYMRQLLPLIDHINYAPLEPERANMFMPVQFKDAALSSHVEQYLKNKSIEVRRWYYPGLHEHPYFQKVPRYSSEGKVERLEITEKITNEIMCLPFHTFLTPEQHAVVINEIKMAVESYQSLRKISNGAVS